MYQCDEIGCAPYVWRAGPMRRVMLADYLELRGKEYPTRPHPICEAIGISPGVC